MGMDEPGIRALLRANVEWGVVPGARVVTEQGVAEAGADVDAVHRYITAHGGRRIVPVRPGPTAVRPYWRVPDAVLSPI